MKQPVRSLVVFLTFCASLLSTPEQSNQDAGVRAVTHPSADITLSFVQPGRVALIHFKEGDSVSIGDVLVQLDDAVEQAQLTQLIAESENTTQIRASEASLAQKRVDLNKLEKAVAYKAATELEVEHAKLDVSIAELSLELAKFEHEQAKRKSDEHKIRVENMRIKSPIDGRVEKLEVEAGESVNAMANVAQIVQIDPLWIDVPVPLVQAMSLKYGSPVKVEFPDLLTEQIEGKIIFIAAVADAASDTLRVRVEAPNKMNRPAGEHVKVIFGTNSIEE
jgi:membrane fusion protein (multidrug efflux system)